MAVTHLRMREVKHQRIKKQEQQVGKCCFASVSKSLPEADEHHHGQGYGEVNVGGVVEFNLQIIRVEIPEGGPGVNKSSQAHHKILRGMLCDIVERFAPLLLHVGNLSEAHEFGQFFIIDGRMSHDVDPAFRMAVIPDPNFEPEIVAQWNRLGKRAVIADLPRQKGNEQTECYEGSGLEPCLAILP